MLNKIIMYFNQLKFNNKESKILIKELIQISNNNNNNKYNLLNAKQIKILYKNSHRYNLKVQIIKFSLYNLIVKLKFLQIKTNQYN